MICTPCASMSVGQILQVQEEIYIFQNTVLLSPYWRLSILPLLRFSFPVKEHYKPMMQSYLLEAREGEQGREGKEAAEGRQEWGAGEKDSRGGRLEKRERGAGKRGEGAGKKGGGEEGAGRERGEGGKGAREGGKGHGRGGEGPGGGGRGQGGGEGVRGGGGRGRRGSKRGEEEKAEERGGGGEGDRRQGKGAGESSYPCHQLITHNNMSWQAMDQKDMPCQELEYLSYNSKAHLPPASTGPRLNPLLPPSTLACCFSASPNAWCFLFALPARSCHQTWPILLPHFFTPYCSRSSSTLFPTFRPCPSPRPLHTPPPVPITLFTYP